MNTYDDTLRRITLLERESVRLIGCHTRPATIHAVRDVLTKLYRRKARMNGMVKQFTVQTPEQLKVLYAMKPAKYGNSILFVAQVWSAARNGEGGDTEGFDGKVYVTFETKPGKRLAEVCRIARDGTPKLLGVVPYIKALQYCKEHMPRRV